MSRSSLWHSLRRAHVGRVVTVYLAASWVVLQVADTLGGGLGLPGWVFPVTLILLLIGLPLVVATAWIQSLPSTTAGERAGDLPGDWQIAPLAALADLRRGRLPHLTWGRALAGGVVALSLLFGGAGLYVGLASGGGLGPVEASADEAADGIAVVPFEVTASDLEIWREGMMDLLTNGMDGVGGFRTIDTRTVMARWREQVGPSPTADLATTLQVASSTGARYGLVGSVVGLGGDVRLTANVYDLGTGEELAQGQTQGPAAEVLTLADELVVESMRSLLGALGRDVAGRFRPEALTTSSLPALRAFLEGEAHYRRGRFGEAVAAYERAVEQDSLFALSWSRLSEAYGWLDAANSETYYAYAARADAQAHRLPPRYRALHEGTKALNEGTPHGMRVLQDAVRRYPDDPEAWFLLVESYIHLGESTYGTIEDLQDAARRAVALDPDFAPYLIHAAEVAVFGGEREIAEETVRRYARLTGDSTELAYVELAIPLLLGDSAESARALEAARGANADVLGRYLGSFARWHDRIDVDAAISRMLAEKEGRTDGFTQALYAAAAGELRRGARMVADPTLSPSQRAMWWAFAAMQWDVEAPAAADPGGPLGLEDCDEPDFDVSCHAFVGVAAARWGRADLNERSVSRLREEMIDAPREPGPGSVEQLGAYADVAEGAWAWRHGDRARGRELLERWSWHGHQAYTNWEGSRARIELGWLEAAEGRPAEAVRHFRAEALFGWDRPMAVYGLARMYRELGQEEESRRWYGRFATLTRSGDDLERIREAREASAR